MSASFSQSRPNKACWALLAVALAAVLISSTTALAQTLLLNGSFEDPVVTTGNMLEAVPTDWRQTYGNAPINIYRPGVGDPFYGQIPDGDQAVFYTASQSQELQPGAAGAEGTGVIMQEGVGVRLLFDAVYYGENEAGTIQISALNTVDYNHQFFTPNSATDGFGTFTYRYMPVAADVGNNFSFWCYSTTGASEFLVDNFRYETHTPLVKPPKPGPVAGGPVIDGGTTPYAWYRADAGVTPYDGDTTKIAWWQDQSGNSRHAESFGEPSITNNGNDNSQVISFDGGGDELIGDSTEWGQAAPGTVFAVWQRSDDATGDNYIYDAQLDEQRQLLHIVVEDERLEAGGAVYDGGWINHLSSDVADPGADQWFVTSASHVTSATDTLRLNGEEIYSGDMLSGGMTGLRIGSYVLDQHYWQGDIAELIVFEGELSAAEREAIEDQLMDRWGVSSTGPTPGDANEDGYVDVSDLGILATSYGVGSGLGWGDADFTGDGIVDVSDLGVLATNYGTVPTAQAVPEPSTLAGLLGLCLAGLPATARRRSAR